jgi:MerR family transcriptional regulator, redox-sensitive transcriptional activator SoxR
MENWAIGEVAMRSGVPASTIRYYEQINLLPPSARLNGRRRYGEGVFRQLGVIRLAQQAGYTIAEIQMLLHDFPAGTPPSERWRVLAQQKLVELDELMHNIRAMKALLEETLTCACDTLEDCAEGGQRI